MFRDIGLEVSLKAFDPFDDQTIVQTAKRIFTDWHPLVADAPSISVMLWVSDGSEILEYQGKDDATFEWCYWLGQASRSQEHADWEIVRRDLSKGPMKYRENPPAVTYGILKKIVHALKDAGSVIFPDKQIRVGETFDPGPEFARSDFKYNRHPEINEGVSFGGKGFVCAYNTLHADARPYAGFPGGIPEGTPFGTFLGRQSQIFLPAMGFDFLWLSNGFGFGSEPWCVEGAIFHDGAFHNARFEQIRHNVLEFWRLFRKECPKIPLETRGTNLSAAIDYATDGVPLKDIYEGNFKMLPPPNSPWAALNYNLGLEIAGHMSRIAKLPDDAWMFRYYIHDPWWANSPWYDRYEGQPYDIYLPLAIGRINQAGSVEKPTHLSLLTIDNSYGKMPSACVNEPIPHLLKGYKDAADAIGPFVWVYPFDEYLTTKEPDALAEMFASDWLITSAINRTFPLNTVVASDYFETQPLSLYKARILVSPIPRAGSALETKLFAFLRAGGKVIFYGALRHASQALLQILHLRLAEDGICGELPITCLSPLCDTLSHGELPQKINHDPVANAGKIYAVEAECASEMQPLVVSGSYVLATASAQVAWIRGTTSASSRHCHNAPAPAEAAYFETELLFRMAAAKLGYRISINRYEPQALHPALTVNRSNGARIFSVCNFNTENDLTISTPDGAPLLIGYETIVKENAAHYRFPRSEHRECRVFVQQEAESLVSCREIPPICDFYHRIILVEGLKDATLRFYKEQTHPNTELLTGYDPVQKKRIFTAGKEEGEYVEYSHLNGCVKFLIQK